MTNKVEIKNKFDKILEDLREENEMKYGIFYSNFIKGLEENQMGHIGGQFSKYKYKVRIVLYSNFILSYGESLLKTIINILTNHNYGILNESKRKEIYDYVTTFFLRITPEIIKHIKDYYNDYPDELPDDFEIENTLKVNVETVLNKLNVNLNTFNAKSDIYPSGQNELRTLVYCKYLYNQGCKFIDNTSNSAYFNISIILFSNAVELAIKTVDECVNGKNNNRYKVHISVITKELYNSNIQLPYTDIYQLFESRNNLYHNGQLLVYETCKSFKDACYDILSRITELLFDNHTFNKLSIVTLIQDEKIRTLLVESEDYFNKKDYEQSIYKSTEAFGHFEFRLKDRGSANSDRLMSKVKDSKIDWKRQEQRYLDKRESNTDLISFSRHADETVNRKFEGFLVDFDIIITLRNHYEEYKHFKRNCPIYHLMMDRSVLMDTENRKQIDFTQENAEFILNFTTNVVLDLEPQFKPIVQKFMSGDIWRIIE